MDIWSWLFGPTDERRGGRGRDTGGNIQPTTPIAAKPSDQPRHGEAAEHREPAAEADPQDEAVEFTFPASDPTAIGQTTSTEPPHRPVDREAPVITREDIERARRGGGRTEN